MAKRQTSDINAHSGLATSKSPREHYDIYAVVQAPQELYFGDEVQVNVNIVEQVKLKQPNGETIQRCYMSPTKRRGVERRTLLWSPASNGQMLSDVYECGIPKACAKRECPICSIFGALRTDEKITFMGRLTHGGGVALQAQSPEQKQRAMHPAKLRRDKSDSDSPIPFQREYNEPGLLYPISNHLLSVTAAQFSGAAYAFLQSLSRLGAGNPKGVRIYEQDKQPLLVVDHYLSPMGKRPLPSPLEQDPEEALKEFVRLAHHVGGKAQEGDELKAGAHFTRYIGDRALAFLQSSADDFVTHVMQQAQ